MAGTLAADPKMLFVAVYQAHHWEEALTNLTTTLQKPWTMFNEWHKLLDKLRSLIPGGLLPRSQCLFSFL
jgi:hypothetical protein